MLEQFNKYAPIVSVVALAAVAIFNVGYFGALGMHFIGVMDLSNIIYSVGLTFSVVLAVTMGLSGDVTRKFVSFAEKAGAFLTTFLVVKWVMGTACLIFVVGLFLGKYVSSTLLFAGFYFLACIASIALYFVVWKETGVLKVDWIVTATSLGVLSIICFGSWSAKNEAFESATKYDISTKGGNLIGVRIARTSSTGFLIARDKVVMFIPIGEIKMVTRED